MLYLFPNDTGNWWPWEIRPSMTALIMGAGYIAGAYFFVRVARATRWHRVHLGFLPITAFTTFLGVATLRSASASSTSSRQRCSSCCR